VKLPAGNCQWHHWQAGGLGRGRHLASFCRLCPFLPECEGFGLTLMGAVMAAFVVKIPRRILEVGCAGQFLKDYTAAIRDL